MPHWRTPWRRRKRAHYSRGLRLRFILIAAMLVAAAIGGVLARPWWP